jgi:hypothetical protein
VREKTMERASERVNGWQQEEKKNKRKRGLRRMREKTRGKRKQMKKKEFIIVTCQILTRYQNI